MSPYITTTHKYLHHESAPAANSRQGRTSYLVPSLNVIMCSALVAAAVGYLLLLNSLVSQSYALGRLQSRLNVLQESNEQAERQTAAMQYPEALSKLVPTLGLVPAGETSYAKPATLVAQKVSSVVP